jgi:antitoxin (DNA-binding transcriptional repressor) of toxin-antitoxin stability system
MDMRSDTKRNIKGVEEARKTLPAILEAAARGQTTIITRHGNAIAAVVPVEAARPANARSLLSLAGTGKGMWGRDSTKGVARLREEWNR